MKALFAICLAAAVCEGQNAPPAKRPNNYRSSGISSAGRPRFVSPEVQADGRVTFRLRAAKANEVSLQMGGSARPMTKDADSVWTITVGPLQPEIYTYAFMVDGLRVLDAANASVKTGINGIDANSVEVPGRGAPRFDEVQNVPHGAVHVRSYFSNVMKKTRELYVYAPPEYDCD